MSRRPRIRARTDARSWLKAARERIDAFDDTLEATHLVHAALDLRMGIESRLQDYLRATWRALGREPPKSLGYQAKKLLAALIREAPHAEGEVHLRMKEESSGKATGLQYTPVRRPLAQRHSRLGEFLHYDFIPKGFPALLVYSRTHEGTVTATGRVTTYLDLRDFLEETADELAEACRGTMLTAGMMTRWVEEHFPPDPDE